MCAYPDQILGETGSTPHTIAGRLEERLAIHNLLFDSRESGVSKRLFQPQFPRGGLGRDNG
jgi:hypothetical protein